MGAWGELAFDNDTANDRLISDLSLGMTLEPGDIIATGTAAGVGFVRRPQVFLRAGDVLKLEIEGIGVLRNPVAA